MKKISTFTLITTLFSAGTFAAAPESKDAARKIRQMSRQFIFLCLIERMNLHHHPIYTKKKCLNSKKTEKVCWVATGNFGKKATVNETFKAQAKIEFKKHN